MKDQDRIDLLVDKLNLLIGRHTTLTQEVQELRSEIKALQTPESLLPTTEQPAPSVEAAFPGITPEVPASGAIPGPPKPADTVIPQKPKPKVKSNLEKFIGENLINKIGIAITVLGVGIGAKYAIDHELISPLTRIILGYLIGIGLMGFAIVLKKKYLNFSSVLLSGAMAIMYFITYFAYSYYQIIPQGVTFGLMVIFTVFTVIAALSYNKQMIAHLGLVGAYAVPFLLSNNSGQIHILLVYMAIINVGILAISFKKYWKPLVYSAFVLTWLIYCQWFISDYRMSEHFTLAFTMLAVYFGIFYVTVLAYKLIQKEQFKIDDIFLLLINSFLFFGLGYAILSDHLTGEHLLGLFTVINGLIHFVASLIIYRQKLADRKLFYLVSGLVLVFITIAIPIQLDGNWVTLIWAGEAALLFWIGRTKDASIYEKLSYVMMGLAFISIVDDWDSLYNIYYQANAEAKITPIFNINFLSSMLVVSAYAFINWVHATAKTALIKPASFWNKSANIFMPGLLLVTLYYSIQYEIINYWEQLYDQSSMVINEGENQRYFSNYDLDGFKTIWVTCYSMLFLSLLSVVNLKKIRSSLLGYVNLGFIAIALLVYLTDGLYTLGELRDSYLDQELSEYYQIGIYNIVIRYISYGFLAALLWALYGYVKSDLLQKNFKIAFDIILYGCIVWVASAELIHWMELASSTQSYKLGLSILWGVYSLFLIALGIWKKKKHLRIGAIVLFGFTLIKLFFYDITQLDTIAKTIVFVSLGILLLIISFLYNKYKHIISDESESN